MKVNSINNTQSFGRIIPIDTVENTRFMNEKYIDKSYSELVSVLNSEGSDIYTGSEQKKIRTFFQKTLQDYNGVNGVSLYKLGGKSYLFSGKEAELIEKKKQHLNRNTLLGHLIHSKKKQPSNDQIIGELVHKKSEDGFSYKEGRPYTELYTSSKELKSKSSVTSQASDKKMKFDYFYYNSIGNNPFKITTSSIDL